MEPRLRQGAEPARRLHAARHPVRRGGALQRRARRVRRRRRRGQGPPGGRTGAPLRAAPPGAHARRRRRARDRGPRRQRGRARRRHGDDLYRHHRARAQRADHPPRARPDERRGELFADLHLGDRRGRPLHLRAGHGKDPRRRRCGAARPAPLADAVQGRLPGRVRARPGARRRRLRDHARDQRAPPARTAHAVRRPSRRPRSLAVVLGAAGVRRRARRCGAPLRRLSRRRCRHQRTDARPSRA